MGPARSRSRGTLAPKRLTRVPDRSRECAGGLPAALGRASALGWSWTGTRPTPGTSPVRFGARRSSGTTQRDLSSSNRAARPGRAMVLRLAESPGLSPRRAQWSAARRRQRAGVHRDPPRRSGPAACSPRRSTVNKRPGHCIGDVSTPRRTTRRSRSVRRRWSREQSSARSPRNASWRAKAANLGR